MFDMKDNQSQKIMLQAAEEEFLTKGFAGARTTEIAKRAGMNHSMLHYYYSTKEELFNRVMEDKIAQLRESIGIVFQDENLPVIEKVVAITASHFDFISSNPKIPRFIINEIIARPEYMRSVKEILQTSLGHVIVSLQRDIDEAARDGQVCPMNASTLIMDILSLNAFAFIAYPIIQEVNPDMDLTAFYEERKRENLEIIRKRLTPNI